MPAKLSKTVNQLSKAAAENKRTARTTTSAASCRKGQPAPERDPNAVNVFISYRHEERVIAEALRDAFIEISRTRVDCFLDVASIRAGEEWEKRLDEALERAGWLVAIYTGEQSESHSLRVAEPQSQNYRALVL